MPVSPVTAAARFADDGVARKVRTPVPGRTVPERLVPEAQMPNEPLVIEPEAVRVPLPLQADHTKSSKRHVV